MISYFDTNNDHHHHFYDPKTGELIDIPHEQITIAGLPNAPKARISTALMLSSAFVKNTL